VVRVRQLVALAPLPHVKLPSVPAGEAARAAVAIANE
jgi:hypothetical protein